MADGASVAGRDFLGVSRSFSGRAWRVRDADEGLIDAHRRRQRLPEIAARLLAARGVSADGAARFLEPTLKAEFPDPSSFIDMDAAASIIEDAIVSGRPTAVFADYDVDGGTSAAQLARYFRLRGRELRIYVPDRMAEGYGPNAGAFETLKAEGIELVVTVDCGGTAYDALNAASAIGLDVVVIDHHLMSGPPPKALAVVNPNRQDCPSGQGALTAAGVVLVAMAALNREARKRGSIGSNNLPDLLQMLDLSALGTVCDVAPLTGFNRAIVAQGLKVLSRKEKAGIAALAETAGRQKLGEVYDLGFVLGPRLNAGGRIGDATLAARLLTTDDPVEAADIAVQLEALNIERRQREADMLIAAITAAEADDSPVIVVGDPGWHPGVIGIAAGRVKDRVLKPTVVLGGGGNGEPAKGSGRSTPGVNLGKAVAGAHGAGILRAGGGHAAAAGLTVDWDRVDELRAFLGAALADEIKAAEGEARTLWLDALASPAAVNLDLMAAIERIGPYGAGHPEPLFAMAELKVAWSALVKGEHVRCVLEDSSRNKLKAISFRSATQPLGEALLTKDRLVHVALRLKRNDYGGQERVEAEIVDAAAA